MERSIYSLPYSKSLNYFQEYFCWFLFNLFDKNKICVTVTLQGTLVVYTTLLWLSDLLQEYLVTK